MSKKTELIEPIPATMEEVVQPVLLTTQKPRKNPENPQNRNPAITGSCNSANLGVFITFSPSPPPPPIFGIFGVCYKPLPRLGKSAIEAFAMCGRLLGTRLSCGSQKNFPPKILRMFLHYASHENLILILQTPQYTPDLTISRLEYTVCRVTNYDYRLYNFL